MNERLLAVATQARKDLENRTVSKDLLVQLYKEYNPSIDDISAFIEKGLSMFPRLSCGIASVYFMHLLREGEILKCKFKDERHTCVTVGETIVDITSDQYGGSSVYVGDLREPWRKLTSN